MAHTQQGRTTSQRHILRREVAGTIGLLADEQDFTAMRRYRSFTFEDHKTYLRQVEGLLKSVASAGGHTTVALFDPVEYAEFCAESGLEPDTAISRTRFTAELASIGPCLPYEGQPLADLVPDLVEEAVRQATWTYASSVLTRIGPCRECGQDIGRIAFARASYLFARVLDSIGEGIHHLVCSASTGRDPLQAVLHVDTEAPDTVRLDETAAMELTTVLALAIATDSACAIVLRTNRVGERSRVYGWQVKDEGLVPLTASQVFDAYCVDAYSGELVAPEPDVDYCTAPDANTVDPDGQHLH
ncbi:hypothetical protein [Streptomyces sp. VRA16 Mangrove soil]|uniref:hypothetical protein n=1 Tax=Streptomyces sp. VRA16 Mangrove soil TaxID=2817434 RepID=UPI001A9CFA9B|nr:hypothetical protein [Streptomyces sp. VRA16 Mangrove soil]MBO1331475.1 hypothetical protein [Streptomyces sp. VRA16 Mangrove soil]